MFTEKQITNTPVAGERSFKIWIGQVFDNTFRYVSGPPFGDRIATTKNIKYLTNSFSEMVEKQRLRATVWCCPYPPAARATSKQEPVTRTLVNTFVSRVPLIRTIIRRSVVNVRDLPSPPQFPSRPPTIFVNLYRNLLPAPTPDSLDCIPCPLGLNNIKFFYASSTLSRARIMSAASRRTRSV